MCHAQGTTLHGTPRVGGRRPASDRGGGRDAAALAERDHSREVHGLRGLVREHDPGKRHLALRLAAPGRHSQDLPTLDRQDEPLLHPDPIQQPTGQREINELHVPVGRAVRVVFTSEDVLHDLYIPVFRTKADAIPGRYSSIWFTPTKTGEFHLFCAEYCGTQHSGMIGEVVVMDSEGKPSFSRLQQRGRLTSVVDVGRAAVELWPVSGGAETAAQSAGLATWIVREYPTKPAQVNAGAITYHLG